MVDLIKVQSKETYKGKDGVERHYYNYFIVAENGKKIQVRACFPKQDSKVLDFLAKYQPNK